MILARGMWLNTPHPLQLTDFRGQALLLDVWDYTCVNCLRTLPYIQEWHKRYGAKGLAVIGVHTPEFDFGRERTQVELAISDLQIEYPVLMDNDFSTWNALENEYWPARYLIDPRGVIRSRYYGEGNYEELEADIQTVLREIDSNVELPPILTPIRPEDYADSRHYQATHGLRVGLRQGALGNPEGYAGGVPIVYSLPSERHPGEFYVAGAWQAASQYLMYQGTNEGLVQVPYKAAEVHAVLSPHADTVERMLNPEPVSVEIWQDDKPIDEELRGVDVRDDGRLLVNRPRMYNLIRNPNFEQHELTLRVKSPGFALYGFSFTSTLTD